MVTEPQTIRDVWYMETTSSRNHLYFESLSSFDEMEVGDAVEKYTDISVNFSYTVISVVEYESQCVKIDRDKRSYSTVSKELSRDEYDSIDSFKESPYYADFISRYADGSSDSSWFDDVSIRHNEHDGDIQIDCELGEPQWDWLNRRYRTAKYHRPLSLMIDTHYGTIDIESGDKYFNFTLKELADMVDTIQLLKDNGIDIDKYDGIHIPWKKED